MGSVEEKFWVLEPYSLMASLRLVPNCQMTDDEKLNALTRLVLVIALIMYAAGYENAGLFLVAGLILVVILYLIKDSQKTRIEEGFYPDTGTPKAHTKVEPVIAPRSHDLDLWRGRNSHTHTDTNHKVITDISQFHPVSGSVGSDHHPLAHDFPQDVPYHNGPAPPRVRAQQKAAPRREYFAPESLGPSTNHVKDGSGMGYGYDEQMVRANHPQSANQFAPSPEVHCTPNCQCGHDCACKGGGNRCRFEHCPDPNPCSRVSRPGRPPFDEPSYGVPGSRSDLGYYRLHAQTIQPNMYSINEAVEPINYNLARSQVPAQGQAVFAEPRHTWFHHNDPQLVRDHPSGARRAEMPVRDTQSMKLSGYEAQGSVPLDGLYDARDSGYADPDRAYVDEQLGQVKYYYGDVDAYRAPNFISRSKIDHIDVGTPMGKVLPHYVRTDEAKNQFSVYGTREQAENAWIEDTTRHREELMERQMRKRNSELWQLRAAPLQGGQGNRYGGNGGSKLQGARNWS